MMVAAMYRARAPTPPPIRTIAYLSNKTASRGAHEVTPPVSFQYHSSSAHGGYSLSYPPRPRRWVAEPGGQHRHGKDGRRIGYHRHRRHAARQPAIFL